MRANNWRQYRPEDEPALRSAHGRQCRRLGCHFAFPDFSDPRYILALVSEENGGVQGAVVAHATIELMFVGGNRRLLRRVVRDREYLRNALRAAGADEAHAFVPGSRLRGMEAILRRLGFRRSNPDYITFYREL